MKSTMGRPRALTDANVERILAWHDVYRAWQAAGATIPTLRQLAAELGVAPSTVSRVIACQGRYKQPSPELRDLECAQRRRVLAQLSGRMRR